MDWSNTAADVQGVWNDFEAKLINVVDKLIPLTELKNNYLPNSPNQHIKRKQNKRKRLLKAFKNNPTLDLKHRIKNLFT